MTNNRTNYRTIDKNKNKDQSLEHQGSTFPLH